MEGIPATAHYSTLTDDCPPTCRYSIRPSAPATGKTRPVVLPSALFITSHPSSPFCNFIDRKNSFPARVTICTVASPFRYDPKYLPNSLAGIAFSSTGTPPRQASP
jgi:hypothetical protein